MGRFLGMDAAGKHGWVGVLIDDDGVVDLGVGSLREVIAAAEPVTVIAVDCPIGNVPGGGRDADRLARAFVGLRASSVFAAPPVEILGVASYEDANRMLSASGRPKLSRQAWALVPIVNAIQDASGRDGRIVEVHPEVSFRGLAGEVLPWPKASWNGLMLRRRLLSSVGIELPESSESLGRAGADDVVDAAVAAWTARRIGQGQAQALPSPPQVVDGRDVAIWW